MEALLGPNSVLLLRREGHPVPFNLVPVQKSMLGLATCVKSLLLRMAGHSERREKRDTAQPGELKEITDTSPACDTKLEKSQNMRHWTDC
ncbi:short transient receptor potential channel 3-like isoform X1 [Lates japonicus]|uniref:Short transient receptor potential channel 3-like isoform X1 n=1 Tax=Lates japonicus TaxID=270547 RepID=A0AAD3M5M6_LATJO|nr:short transient receptor potential channel 3-like isoform X1 [Lates japonicus]